MPRKTIYVKEEEINTWEEAEKLLRQGESLSSVITKKLQGFVQERRVIQEGMGRIEVSISRSARSSANKDTNKNSVAIGTAQAFFGRWLVRNMPGERSSVVDGLNDALNGQTTWNVALTAKGQIAIYRHTALGGGHPIEVYPTLDAALDDGGLPHNVYNDAAKVLGLSYVQELDI